MPAPEETDNQHDAQADDTDSSRPLSIPELPPDVDILTAALAYAECGWYVLPVRRGTKKNPGSVVGDHWQDKSSRDPAQIAAWFAGTDRDIALHCGRSGAVVVDVDKPDKVPGEWAAHLDPAPCQSTRPDTPGRGHYAFAMPPGRSIGNPTRPWGEIRGLNGVIMAEPQRRRRIQVAAHRPCLGAAARDRRRLRRHVAR